MSAVEAVLQCAQDFRGLQRRCRPCGTRSNGGGLPSTDVLGYLNVAAARLVRCKYRIAHIGSEFRLRARGDAVPAGLGSNGGGLPSTDVLGYLNVAAARLARHARGQNGHQQSTIQEGRFTRCAGSSGKVRGGVFTNRLPRPPQCSTLRGWRNTDPPAERSSTSDNSGRPIHTLRDPMRAGAN